MGKKSLKKIIKKKKKKKKRKRIIKIVDLILYINPFKKYIVFQHKAKGFKQRPWLTFDITENLIYMPHPYFKIICLVFCFFCLIHDLNILIHISNHHLYLYYLSPDLNHTVHFANSYILAIHDLNKFGLFLIHLFIWGSILILPIFLNHFTVFIV